MRFPTHRRTGVSHLPFWVLNRWCSYMGFVGWQKMEELYEWVDSADVTRVCARCRDAFEFHMESRWLVVQVLERT